jgi:hypothetical protein
MAGFSDYVSSPFKMLNSFLNPQEGYDQAGNEIQNYWNQSKGFLQPYNDAGTNQIPKFNNAIDKLLNPAELQNEWANSYEMSPYATQLQDSATASGLDSASQQGLLGSSAALNNVQTTSGNIMRSDRSSFMKELLDKYIQGISASQNLVNTGFNAGSTLTGGALQTGQNLGAAKLGAANAPGELLGKMIGTGVGAYINRPGAVAGGA